MKNRTSKILITGGAGYSGTHVLVELLLANQQILQLIILKTVIQKH